LATTELCSEFDAYPWDEPRPKAVTLQKLLLWSAVIFAAFLVLELTAQPALSVPILCSKFGWSDFATGFWLWRVDPQRRRGRIHFGLFLFVGLWKMAVAAGLVMIPLGLWLAEQPAPAQQGVMGQRLFWVFMTFIGGFAVAGIVALVTFAAASWYGIKVWLEPAVHRARRSDLWPPPDCRENHAAGMFLAALIPLFFLIGVLGLAIIAVWNNQGQFVNQDLVLILSLFAIGIGVPVVSLSFNDIIRQRVVAQTPQECWDMP